LAQAPATQLTLAQRQKARLRLQDWTMVRPGSSRWATLARQRAEHRREKQTGRMALAVG
jgi:hypothetical protein